ERPYRPPLLVVQLIEERALAQIETAARPAVRAAALGPVVEAPAGSAAGARAGEIGRVVVRQRLPGAVAAPERLLVVDRHHAPELRHRREVRARLRLRLPRRGWVAGPVGREEVHFDVEQ